MPEIERIDINYDGFLYRVIPDANGVVNIWKYIVPKRGVPYWKPVQQGRTIYPLILTKYKRLTAIRDAWTAADEAAKRVLDTWCAAHVAHYIPTDPARGEDPEAYRHLHTLIRNAIQAGVPK